MVHSFYGFGTDGVSSPALMLFLLAYRFSYGIGTVNSSPALTFVLTFIDIPLRVSEGRGNRRPL